MNSLTMMKCIWAPVAMAKSRELQNEASVMTITKQMGDSVVSGLVTRIQTLCT